MRSELRVPRAGLLSAYSLHSAGRELETISRVLDNRYPNAVLEALSRGIVPNVLYPVSFPCRASLRNTGDQPKA